MTNSDQSSFRHRFLGFIWDSRCGPVIEVRFRNRRLSFPLICHRKPERCLTIFGHRSFLCSRCTGIALGLIAASVFALLGINMPSATALPLIAPMLIDGFSQLFGLRMSNNPLRLITGFLFPIGFLSLLVN
jgi:uncharacterized membrane protein